MMDWDVLDEAEGHFPPQAQAAPTARRGGWRVALWLLALVGGVAAFLLWQGSQREARLRADLEAVMVDEARAQAFGLRERAADLADPAAPQGWFARYVALFEEGRAAGRPALQGAIWQEGRVVAEITWPEARWPHTERRAYRLVGTRWRRTALPLDEWEPTEVQETAHFRLRAAPDDFAALTDDPTLRLNLEPLRSRVITYWPDTWANYFLTVTIQPAELAPPILHTDAQTVRANSPTLARLDPDATLPPHAQYRLALITAVVEWLTTPDALRQPTAEGDAALPRPEGWTNWATLVRLLQQAEARHWALDGVQRRDLRNAWRADLSPGWASFLSGALPADPHHASPDERQRWLVLNLLIEQQIARGGVAMPGRLARIALAYPPDDFDTGRFFAAVVGGSLRDVEALARDYVTTMEP